MGAMRPLGRVGQRLDRAGLRGGADMTTTNGWAGKPGVPLNPERDGWHIVQEGDLDPEFAFWRAKPWLKQAIGCWEMKGTLDDLKGTLDYLKGTLDDFQPQEVSNWRYLGPALTPDEAAALQKRVAKLEEQNDMLRHANDKLRAMLTELNARHEPLQRAFITAVELLNDAASTGGKDE